MTPKKLNNVLTRLSKLQFALDKKGGPSEDGKLFDEILSHQEGILRSFGLTPTEKN